jgi:hypothetical protein
MALPLLRAVKIDTYQRALHLDVVFEGALSRSWGMADVLRGIMGVENQRFGVLRVSSPGSNVSGRLAIAESQFIVGALLSDGTETGYQAVRRLLLANDGNFAYLDAGTTKPQDFDQGLYIPLGKMADIWPNLPEDPNDLFDEKSLLDKVFGGDGGPPSSGHVPIIQAEQEALPSRPTRASLVKAMKEAANSGAHSSEAIQEEAWGSSSIKPLLSNSLVDGAKTFPGSIPGLEDTSSNERQSLTKLRAVDGPEEESWLKKMMKESFGPKQAILWFLAFCIVLLIATFVATRALK